MSCTLKILSGPEANQEFTLAGGESFVGRSQRCSVRLTSPSISYEHAVITREADDYFIENLSANGTYVNNERINARTRLRSKDQIRLSPEVAARVTSVPATAKNSSTRRVLVILIAMMLVCGIILIELDPFSGSSTADWNKAYSALQDFAQQESNGRDLPRDAAPLLRDAWLYEMSKDRPAASQAWVRLHVLLSDKNDKYGIESLAANNRRALGHLLDPQQKNPELTQDDFYKAALLQFVMQMERRK